MPKALHESEESVEEGVGSWVFICGCGSLIFGVQSDGLRLKSAHCLSAPIEELGSIRCAGRTLNLVSTVKAKL